MQSKERISMYESHWRTIEHLKEEIKLLKQMIVAEKQEENDTYLINQWEQDIKSHESAIDELKAIDLQSLRIFCE
jgi:chromosome segregation ATPase